jgi:hypothetical protein
MAAVTLVENKTDAGASTGVEITGPGVVYFEGTFDGARVRFDMARTNDVAKFHPAGKAGMAQRRTPGSVRIDEVGTFFGRVFIVNPGANTDISAYYNQ